MLKKEYDKIRIDVSDEVIKEKVGEIISFRNNLEKYLKENADQEMWKMYSYNFCNHCAIGLAYYLGKIIPDYKFKAYEGYFVPDGSLDYGTITPQLSMCLGGMFNHAYVIASHRKTNNKVIVDMERFPIWYNVISDIPKRNVVEGKIFKNMKEVKRRVYNLDKSLSETDFLTQTNGKVMFDEVIKMCQVQMEYQGEDI